MNYLKKFNESVDYDSYFKLSDEDIEEIMDSSYKY